MSRIGLGRHSGIEDDAGDPLDGLVNLFDIGVVLAVAFLVAGLGLTVDPHSKRIEARGGAPATTPTRTAPTGGVASGKGTSLGQLYRLADGRLVVVEGSRTTSVAP